MQKEIDEAARRLVSNEVHTCVSTLVSELLKRAYEPGALMSEDDAMTLSGRAPDADDYDDALPQGLYVIESGSDPRDDATGWRWWRQDEETPDRSESEWFDTKLEALRNLYQSEGLGDPEGSEAMEHWVVSDWLADKLEAHGESVVRDMQGLTVWARCTSGQAIYADYVIQQIARGLAA